MRDEKLAYTAIEIAKRWLGVPYKWGGKTREGIDCSGFIIEILQSVDRFPRYTDMTAADLFKKYPSVDYPSEGCLVFYYNPAKTRIIHIEMFLNADLTIGAVIESGSGSKIKTLKDAVRHNAFVKIRPLGSLKDRPIAGITDPFLKKND